MALLTALLAPLEELALRADSTCPSGSLNAAKGLEKVLQQADRPAHDTGSQRRIGEETLEALAGSADYATLLCRAITCATATVATLDATEVVTVDGGEGSSPARAWFELRTSVLACLVCCSCSEERACALLEGTELPGSRGAASVCLDLLAERSSTGDTDGIRTAATLLRQLALPLLSRERIGALRSEVHAASDGVATIQSGASALHVLIRHAGVREPNATASIAACLRVLVLDCPQNAIRYVREAAGMVEHSDEEAAAPATAAAFVPLVALELQHERRVGRAVAFARVDFSRFVCLTLAAACEPAGTGVPPPTVQQAGCGHVGESEQCSG